MRRNEHDISFRPVVAGDVPMLRQWMVQDHWREWWGDVETELGYIIDMIEGRDTTCPFIFMIDGLDTGYIQYWTVGDNLVEPFLSEAPWMLKLEPQTIGVDLSIGEGKNLAKGIGSSVLRAFTTKLTNEGFKTIIIDPDAQNKRAIRAYQKAGFKPIDSLLGKTDSILLMQFDANSTIVI